MINRVQNEKSDDQSLWYALRSKPNFEFIVYSQLMDRNIETYLPWINVDPVNPRSNRKKPYFPGYMFVNGEIGDLYAKRIGLLRGVIGLVNFDGIPAPIPEGLIDIIKRHVTQVKIKNDSNITKFEPGERVWIDDPALEGIEARFLQCINGEDRVAVLLTLLKGNVFRLQIDAAKVKRRAF